MPTASLLECQEWVRLNLGRNLAWASVAEEYPHCTTYRLPVDTGAKTAIARMVSNPIAADGPGLLWITAWGIFPSAANMALFDGYRQYLGESRGLADAPGFIYQDSEREQLESILDLVLYFYWDAMLIDAAGTFVFQNSHDEWLSVSAKTKASLSRLESWIPAVMVESQS